MLDHGKMELLKTTLENLYKADPSWYTDNNRKVTSYGDYVVISKRGEFEINSKDGTIEQHFATLQVEFNETGQIVRMKMPKGFSVVMYWNTEIAPVCVAPAHIEDVLLEVLERHLTGEERRDVNVVASTSSNTYTIMSATWPSKVIYGTFLEVEDAIKWAQDKGYRVNNLQTARRLATHA